MQPLEDLTDLPRLGTGERARARPEPHSAILLVVRPLVAAQPEERAPRLDVESLPALGLVPAQRVPRVMEDLVHDGAGQPLDGSPLPRLDGAQGSQVPLHLALPDVLDLVA